MCIRDRWKDQFERHVKKGEHGITIIAPTPYKKKIEEQKLDPDTKAPILDKDGKIVTEEKEIEIPMFRPVKVFDVSQTEDVYKRQRYACGTGSGMEPSYHQPRRPQVHPLLHRRDAPAFEGGADRRLYGGNLEAIP